MGIGDSTREPLDGTAPDPARAGTPTIADPDLRAERAVDEPPAAGSPGPGARSEAGAEMLGGTAGAMTGAVAGAVVAGPVGALVGGVVGAAVGAAAGEAAEGSEVAGAAAGSAVGAAAGAIVGSLAGPMGAVVGGGLGAAGGAALGEGVEHGARGRSGPPDGILDDDVDAVPAADAVEARSPAPEEAEISRPAGQRPIEPLELDGDGGTDLR